MGCSSRSVIGAVAWGMHAFGGIPAILGGKDHCYSEEHCLH